MILIDDVIKTHGNLVAVDDVTLQLDTGVTAIIGPNGAGKSTLLAAIGRLVGTDAGVIAVDGMDVATTRSREIARRLAILRQDNHLAIRLSVEELVSYGRFPHGGSGRTTDDLAHILLDLDGMRERFSTSCRAGNVDAPSSRWPSHKTPTTSSSTSPSTISTRDMQSGS